MVPNEKILRILEQLLEKSRRNQVNWRRVTSRTILDLSKATPNLDLDEYYVQLAQAKIVLSYRSPPTEVDQIQIRVEESSGQVLWQLAFEEGAANWALIFDLYQEAKRFALGVDKVLVDIENAVNSDGPVGR